MLKKYMLCILFITAAKGSLFAHGAVNTIFNLPTCQTSGSDILLLDVGHRYFDVNRHTTNINITAGYGIIDTVDVFAGFSFKNKDIVAGSKITILNDFSGKGDLFSFAVLFGGGYKDTNGTSNSLSLSYLDNSERKARSVLDSNDRPSFFIQPIIQKHLFGNRLSMGIVPLFAYNTNFYTIKSSQDYSIGCGVFTQVYVFDRISLCGEIIPNLYGFAFKYMNFNAGIKYAGYRHTFSLWVGNSSGYSPVEYIAGNTDLTTKFSFAFTREFDI